MGRARSTSTLRVASILAPALAGLVASAILLVDYVKPAPVFCDVVSGCARLKQTVFASLFGVPTPVFGVIGFVAIALLATQHGPRVRTTLAALATSAAFVAALLLSVQAAAGVWCKFCCVADVSALAACAAAWWRKSAGWDPPEALVPRAAALGVTFAPALAAVAFGATKKPELPGCIARELATTPRGQTTVVDFVDFECPFCRMTHAELAPLLAAHKEKVRLVRKQVPLTRLHPHAMDAARAACCGERLGKGDAMADALFTAPPEELTPDGCAKLASSLGLDDKAFRDCVQDPATDARIHADEGAFKEAQGRGLPTLFIGEERIEGARPGDELEKALARAIDRSG